MPNFPRSCSGKRSAVALVEVRQDLGVAAARERVPSRSKLAPELGVVVELAVLDRDDRAVLVQDRLVATLDVDDREPTHAERDPGRHEGPAVVGAAVSHDVGHDVQRFLREELARLPSDLNDAADSAHVRTP